LTAKTAKDMHRRLTLDVDRIERKKAKTPLGTQGYLNLCVQQCELTLKCLHAVYWASYDGEV